MEKIAGHEVSKSLRVIIIFKPLKFGHFRSWSFPVIFIFRLEYRWLNP